MPDRSRPTLALGWTGTVVITCDTTQQSAVVNRARKGFAPEQSRTQHSSQEKATSKASRKESWYKKNGALWWCYSPRVHGISGSFCGSSVSRVLLPFEELVCVTIRLQLEPGWHRKQGRPQFPWRFFCLSTIVSVATHPFCFCFADYYYYYFSTEIDGMSIYCCTQ